MVNSHRFLLFALVYLIFCQNNLLGKTSYSNKVNRSKTISMRGRIYPVLRDVPVVPDVVVVKMAKVYPNQMFEPSFQNCLQKIGVRSVVHEFAAHREDDTELSKIFRIGLPTGSDIYSSIERLDQESPVIWAEPLYRKKICYEPNDPDVDLQWHLAKIQAREA
jgi:hypothetical protein